jgi:hypothetical protein
MKYLYILFTVTILMLIIACNSEANVPNYNDVEYTFENDEPSQQDPTSQESTTIEPVPPSNGQIHLYGELHSLEHMRVKHFELWSYYYTVHGMRHLILEAPFFTAEFLNIWMSEDNDDIFDSIFQDIRGTAADTVFDREFFRSVKRELPETVFHGVDVGHQYDTTGARFLQHLRESNLENSELYRLAEENIEQGRKFHEIRDSNPNRRTVVMADNFIRAFDSLGNENVMGQFGLFHVNTPKSPMNPITTHNMIAVLNERYGENVHTTDLVEYFARQLTGIPDVVVIGGTKYDAAFFGKQDMSAWNLEYVMREFWLLTDDNIYDVFKNYPTTGDVLPFNNFPMWVEAGQVVVIRYTRSDDTYYTEYLRSDGTVLQGMEVFNTFYIP